MNKLHIFEHFWPTMGRIKNWLHSYVYRHMLHLTVKYLMSNAKIDRDVDIWNFRTTFDPVLNLCTLVAYSQKNSPGSYVPKCERTEGENSASSSIGRRINCNSILGVTLQPMGEPVWNLPIISTQTLYTTYCKSWGRTHVGSWGDAWKVKNCDSKVVKYIYNR